MPEVNTKLLDLADLLETEAVQKHFHMASFYHDPPVWADDEALAPRDDQGRVSFVDCGTTACIAGWALAQHDPLYPFEDRDVNESILDFSKLVDIDYSLAYALCVPAMHAAIDATNPRAAAKVVRHLAVSGEVNWDIVPVAELGISSR